MSTSPVDNNKKDTNEIKIETKKNEVPTGRSSGGSITPFSRYEQDFFESFRQDMQNISNFMERAWSNSMFPSFRSLSPIDWFDRFTDTRLPLCDVIDRGDKYELKLEVPGIDKDKIDVKVTKNTIRITGAHSQKTREKGKNYIYSERSYKSFNRQIPFSQEILPSKVTAHVINGVLEVELPKKVPTKVEAEEEHKVNIS